LGHVSISFRQVPMVIVVITNRAACLVDIFPIVGDVPLGALLVVGFRRDFWAARAGSVGRNTPQVFRRGAGTVVATQSSRKCRDGFGIGVVRDKCLPRMMIGELATFTQSQERGFQACGYRSVMKSWRSMGRNGTKFHWLCAAKKNGVQT
jgi:hypothetical protein